jgi:pimeloyl-ACP methyl ester carboxylesterase
MPAAHHFRRRRMIPVLAAAGAAVAAAYLIRSPAVAPARLELTPLHRGGSGTPLLLLHGISATWRVWSPVLPFLESHHDVIAPTLRGHGGGLPFDDTVTPSLEGLVDAIEQDLDKLGFADVHVVGNSLGGWLAIELARRGRARSVVLLSPAGAWDSPRQIRWTARLIRISDALAGRGAAYADRLATNRLLRWLLYAGQVTHTNRVPPEAVAAQLRASNQAAAVTSLLRVLPESRLEPLTSDHNYPIRVVWPTHDRVLPFEVFGAPTMQRLPGAEVLRLDGVGHVPMTDDPAAVAQLILDLTQSVDASSDHPRSGVCDD